MVDTPTVSTQQIQQVEDVVNELIRSGKKVTVTVYTKESTEEELTQVFYKK